MKSAEALRRRCRDQDTCKRSLLYGLKPGMYAFITQIHKYINKIKSTSILIHYICIYIYTFIHIHTCIPTYIRTCYMHAYIHTYIHTYAPHATASTPRTYAYMDAYLYRQQQAPAICCVSHRLLDNHIICGFEILRLEESLSGSCSENFLHQRFHFGCLG